MHLPFRLLSNRIGFTTQNDEFCDIGALRRKWQRICLDNSQTEAKVWMEKQIIALKDHHAVLFQHFLDMVGKTISKHASRSFGFLNRLQARNPTKRTRGSSKTKFTIGRKHLFKSLEYYHLHCSCCKEMLLSTTAVAMLISLRVWSVTDKWRSRFPGLLDLQVPKK